MINPNDIYEQLIQDSDALFDGMPLDMMRVAVDGLPHGSDPFLVALDADDLDNEIRIYASGGDMSSLTLRQRWCLAARMKLAASVLDPFRRERDSKKDSLARIMAEMSKEQLIEFLLLDMAPSLKDVLSTYLSFAEEWRAPNRLPWNQRLLRKQS